MKEISMTIKSAVLGGILVLACASANAAAFTISVDENGNGIGTGLPPGDLAGGIMGVEQWTSAQLPQSSVLKYWLTLNPGSTAFGGVVNIWQDAAHTTLSDQIAFFPDGVWYIEFISFDHGNSMADSTLYGGKSTFPNPPINTTYLRTLDLVEGPGGITTYTPNDAQPGYVVGGVTYTFLSNDADPGVPDGGTTASLLGMAFLGIAALRRKLAV